MTKYKLLKQLPFHGLEVGMEVSIDCYLQEEPGVEWRITYTEKTSKESGIVHEVNWPWCDPRESDWFEEVKEDKIMRYVQTFCMACNQSSVPLSTDEDSISVDELPELQCGCPARIIKEDYVFDLPEEVKEECTHIWYYNAYGTQQMCAICHEQKGVVGIGSTIEEVKPERWMPEKRGWFYFVHISGQIEMGQGHKIINEAGREWWEYGNYFQTKAQAEAARDAIKKLLSDIHNTGFWTKEKNAAVLASYDEATKQTNNQINMGTEYTECENDKCFDLREIMFKHMEDQYDKTMSQEEVMETMNEMFNVDKFNEAVYDACATYAEKRGWDQK